MNMPMLRMSAHIAVNYVEPTCCLNLGCWLISALIYVKDCVDLGFTPYVVHSLVKKITFHQTRTESLKNVFLDAAQALTNYPCCHFLLIEASKKHIFISFKQILLLLMSFSCPSHMLLYLRTSCAE